MVEEALLSFIRILNENVFFFIMDYRNSTDFENGDNEDNEQERKILFQIKEIDNRIESVEG